MDAWSLDADCETCHELAFASRENPQALASNSDHATLACDSCHDDEAGLSRAHRDADGPLVDANKLHFSTVSSERCLTCHGSLQELAAKTEGSAVLTDSEGAIENPHQLPENDNHATLTCGNCHFMHRETDLAEDARKTCISCHHEGAYLSCSSCHEDMA